ncbi:MAG TPA: hypothetical protein VK982_00570, partial [Bacteroidales bacterium]|nr:hypothetical protein [Bacteroidales bacterium]
DYFLNLHPKFRGGPRDINQEIQTNLYILQELYNITSKNNQQAMSKEIEQHFLNYMQQYR